MKINKLNIVSFGKFQNKEIVFSDGFNLVFGENEMGKTTVMEFIKMMFYGSRGKSADTVNNPRKRYLPWNSDKMAGSIEFEHGGTFYKLEREFKASNSTDKITLWNMDTGVAETLSGAEEVGAKFFGISCGAFEKSVFIANDPTFFADSAADGEINSRLSKLTASFDDDTSAEAVLSRIADAQNILQTKTGRGGSIVKLESEKQELYEAQRQNEELCRRREEINEKIDSLRARLAQNGEERKEYFERIKKAEKSEIRSKLTEFIAAAELYEQTENKIKNKEGNLITEETAEKIAEMLSDYKVLCDSNEKAQQNIDALTAEVAKLSAFDNSAEAQKNEEEKQTLLAEFNENEAKIRQAELELLSLQNNKNSGKKSPNIALLVIGLLLILGGAAAAAVTRIYLIAAVCAAGAVLFILSFILGKRKDNSAALTEKLESEKQNLIAAKESAADKLAEINARITKASVESGTNEKLLAEKREENLRLREEQLESLKTADALKNEIFAQVAPFGVLPDIESAAHFVKETTAAIADLKVLRIKAETAAVGTKCANLAQAKEKLALLGEAESSENPAELKAAWQEKENEKSELEKELAAVSSEAKTAFSGLKTPAEFEKEIAEKQQKIDAQKAYFERLSLAFTGIEKAFLLLRRNYSGVLEQRAKDILCAITSGKYADITVSKNFDIHLRKTEDLSSHSVHNFSRGTSDQAYFSLRLALSEYLSKEQGGMPVLLDDVFSQYDDARFAESFAFLKNYAESAQVVFFTCHGKERQAAADLSANIIEL